MNTTDENVRVDDSAIDWKLISYTVGSCWSIFFLTYLGGMTLTLFLNPLPIVVKGLAGGLIYGYVGAPVAGILKPFSSTGPCLAYCCPGAYIRLKGKLCPL